MIIITIKYKDNSKRIINSSPVMNPKKLGKGEPTFEQKIMSIAYSTGIPYTIEATVDGKEIFSKTIAVNSPNN